MIRLFSFFKKSDKNNLPTRELYISLCNELDNILIDSGIRKICVTCSVRCPFKNKTDYLKDDPMNYSNIFIKEVQKISPKKRQELLKLLDRN